MAKSFESFINWLHYATDEVSNLCFVWLFLPGCQQLFNRDNVSKVINYIARRPSLIELVNLITGLFDISVSDDPGVLIRYFFTYIYSIISINVVRNPCTPLLGVIYSPRGDSSPHSCNTQLQLHIYIAFGKVHQRDSTRCALRNCRLSKSLR